MLQKSILLRQRRHPRQPRHRERRQVEDRGHLSLRRGGRKSTRRRGYAAQAKGKVCETKMCALCGTLSSRTVGGFRTHTNALTEWKKARASHKE